MARYILPFPFLAAVLLLTALASGFAEGQMARDGVFASLGICADDDAMAAPCLDCALAGGLPAGEAGDPALAALSAGAVQPGGDLVAAGRPILGGGARGPPDWV